MIMNSPSSFFYNQSLDSTENYYHEPPLILNSSSSFDYNESPLCQIFSWNNLIAKDHQDSNNKNVSSGKKKGSELEISGVIKPPRGRKAHAATPRKSTGKKDRHTKIHTAQGMRDRRMRLSLPIARRFFDLQDMLGFSKASNTLEWLMSNSKEAIEKLHTNQNPSSIKHPSTEATNKILTNEKKEGSKSKQVMINYKNAKESRQKARARARERTTERLKVSSSKMWNDEIIVPHGIDCSYTNDGFKGILENWDLNGSRMNPSFIGTTSNIQSFSGNHQQSILSSPSKTFPFTLQY